MSDFETYKEQINAIKNIGDQIGYGHLMHIASALWRVQSEENLISKDGVFVPTLKIQLKNDCINETNKDIELYDMLIHNALYKKDTTSPNQENT